MCVVWVNGVGQGWLKQGSMCDIGDLKLQVTGTSIKKSVLRKKEMKNEATIFLTWLNRWCFNSKILSIYINTPLVMHFADYFE